MSNGKGDSPRNCFSDTFRDNYDHIFCKKETDRNPIHWANFAGIDKEGAVDDVSPRWIVYDPKQAQAAVGELDRIFSKEKASTPDKNTPVMGAEKQKKGTSNDDIRKD
jgi:hypothetical protein